ncbi:MAG: hypothetical protein EOP22_18010 [Hyphomicrobiales bacterium]|nr:MAG: hypothetical protein EOP22_18010 [Hyphomicrobiales bacterium]
MPINREPTPSPISALGGISRRELARRADVTEATIRRHLRSGALWEAVLPDGTLDPVKGLALLRTVVTKGKVVDSGLRRATDRFTAAQVGRLEDEVADLQRRYVPVADGDALVAAGMARIAGHLRPLAGSIATAAGLPAKLVFDHARTCIHNALSAISADLLSGSQPEWWDEPIDAWWNEPTPAAPRPMSAVALKAAKLDLGATKLTIERMARNGDVRAVSDIVAESDERVATAKSVLLAIPSRVYEKLSAATPLEGRAMVAEEMAGVFRELGVQLLS